MTHPVLSFVADPRDLRDGGFRPGQPGKQDDTNVYSGAYPLYCDNPTVVTTYQAVLDDPDRTIQIGRNDLTIHMKKFTSTFRKRSTRSKIMLWLLKALANVAVLLYFLFIEPIISPIVRFPAATRFDKTLSFAMLMALLAGYYALGKLVDIVIHLPIIGSMLY